MTTEEIKKVKEEVENYFKIEYLFSRSRLTIYVKARSLFYGVLRSRGMKLIEIAKICGFKSHKTVMEGLKYFDYLHTHDPEYALISNDLIFRNSSHRELLIKEITDKIKTLPITKLKAFKEILK